MPLAKIKFSEKDWNLKTHTVVDLKEGKSSYAEILCNRFGENASPLLLARVSWNPYDEELQGNANLMSVSREMFKACQCLIEITDGRKAPYPRKSLSSAIHWAQKAMDKLNERI